MLVALATSLNVNDVASVKCLQCLQIIFKQHTFEISVSAKNALCKGLH